MGMVAAGQLAVELNLWPHQTAHRQDAVIQKAGLAIELPAGLDLDRIIAALKSDKKVKAGKGIFILPTKIGATATVGYEVSNSTNDLVSDPLIKQVLTAMLPIPTT
jgi:3-dehydroquinate synthase